jgi:Phycobilisome degradation protein nblA
MNEPLELSLEQQANLCIFEMHCKKLTQPQTVALAKEIYRQSLIKETYYKSFLRDSLGIAPPSLEKRHE